MERLDVTLQEEELFELVPHYTVKKTIIVWDNYCGPDGKYLLWEKGVKQYLMAQGWTEIRFMTIEGDSFGPLVRGMIGIDQRGMRRKASYA